MLKIVLVFLKHSVSLNSGTNVLSKLSEHVAGREVVADNNDPSGPRGRVLLDCLPHTHFPRPLPDDLRKIAYNHRPRTIFDISF